MARILSVSYDETLLRTRELLLESAGHSVVSAFGHHEALESCTTGEFELVIIGHSIPKKDKLDVIERFRKTNPDATVIALIRGGEGRLLEVDHYVSPGDPEDLLRSIAWIVNPRRERRTASRGAPSF